MDSSSVNAAASSAEKEYLFTAMPVNRAVISLAVPTVIKSDYNRSLQHGGYIFHWPDERS